MWSLILSNTRAGIRLTLASSCVLAGLCAAAITAVPGMRTYRQRLTLLWFRGMIRSLNVRVEVEGEEAHAGSLQVANHISWLDILVLGATGSTLFVAKAEIAAWPIVGRLASVVGTVFLPRGKHQSSQAAELVAARLSAGDSVVVFPEATTTDGRRTRHFHARFFAASIASGQPVQPIALQYSVPGGDYMAVPYINDMSLGQSMFALLKQPCVEVRVCRQPLIEPGDQDRKTLARAARDSIVAGLAKRDPEIQAPGEAVTDAVAG